MTHATIILEIFPILKQVIDHKLNPYFTKHEIFFSQELMAMESVAEREFKELRYSSIIVTFSEQNI